MPGGGMFSALVLFWGQPSTSAVRVPIERDRSIRRPPQEEARWDQAIAYKWKKFAKFPKSAKQEFGSCWDRHTIRAENPAEMFSKENRP
jgi:hypothetical protein